MSSNNLMCVRVTYMVNEIFKIPKHIDLGDETQVKDWGVKWNTLNIYLTNGEILKVDSEGLRDDFDYKWPDNVEIVDADEVGLDEKDFETEDEKKEEPEPEPKPNVETEVVKKIEFEGKKYLKSSTTGIVYDYDEYLKKAKIVIVGKWNEADNKIDFSL